MLVLLSVGLTACGHLGSRESKSGAPDDRKAAVLLDPELRNMGQVSQLAWVGYGIAKLATVSKRQGKYHNRSVDEFQIELTAHQVLLELWAKNRHENGGSDPYLDRLLTVQKAGFLEEYVVWGFAKPGWTIPAASIRKMDLAAFDVWRNTNLPNHKPQSLAGVATKQSRLAAPGSDLPDGESISPHRYPCAQIQQRLMSAQAAWLATAKRLDGTPRTASALQEFVLVLQAIRGDVTAYPSGVTWVLPRAFDVNFAFGWCANEAQDYKTAQVALERAAALNPWSAGAHIELSHALVGQKKLDQALVEAEAALTLEQGKCRRAVAWRKKGFILFEMGKLKAAYEAYQKSLEFDPGNKIAVQEMVLLAREIGRTDSLSPGDEGRYEGPPASGQVTTECHE